MTFNRNLLAAALAVAMLTAATTPAYAPDGGKHDRYVASADLAASAPSVGAGRHG